MNTIAISLSKIANASTCQAGLTTGSDDIDFPRANTPQQACREAAATLRELADKFDALAQSDTPFNSDTQRAVNLGADFTLLVLPEDVVDELPDYSEVGGFTLDTLNTLMMNAPLFPERTGGIVAQMDDEAKALLDFTLTALCGWALPTLEKMARERGCDWGDMLADELASDEENPFKETGNVLLKWADATTPADAREQVDAFYQALCGQTMTAMVTKIANDIDANM